MFFATNFELSVTKNVVVESEISCSRYNQIIYVKLIKFNEKTHPKNFKKIKKKRVKKWFFTILVKDWPQFQKSDLEGFKVTTIEMDDIFVIVSS